MLFAVAGLLLLGAGAGFALAGPVAGGLLAFMAVVVGGAAFVLGGGSGKAAESESREGIAAVLASLERRVRDRSQLLGFAEVPDVDEVAAQKATREQERVALSDLAADLLRYEQAKATAQANRQRLTELTRQHEQALTHWQAWLAQHQLPQVLRPEGVDEWLSHLDQARAAPGADPAVGAPRARAGGRARGRAPLGVRARRACRERQQRRLVGRQHREALVERVHR